jgi:hypothetical protein
VLLFTNPCASWVTHGLWNKENLFVHSSLKICKGVEVYLHSFLTPALDGDELSASLTGLFIPRGIISGRVQLKRDVKRWRTGGEMKGELANGVGNQYSSHYLGTWCIQHYYRWCAHTRLPVVDWTDAPCRLNGLVRFAERRNIFSARVPSHFKRNLPIKWEAVWVLETFQTSHRRDELLQLLGIDLRTVTDIT